jgi:tryptophan synthase alpha chain
LINRDLPSFIAAVKAVKGKEDPRVEPERRRGGGGHFTDLHSRPVHYPGAACFQAEKTSRRVPASAARIQGIAADARSFLSVVSSLGVTGMRGKIETDLAALLGTIRQVSTLPAVVGFGINTPEQAAAIGKCADGMIVGSAIVKILEGHGMDAGRYIYEYALRMKEALI